MILLASQLLARRKVTPCTQLKVQRGQRKETTTFTHLKSLFQRQLKDTSVTVNMTHYLFENNNLKKSKNKKWEKYWFCSSKETLHQVTLICSICWNENSQFSMLPVSTNRQTSMVFSDNDLNAIIANWRDPQDRIETAVLPDQMICQRTSS